MNLKMIGKKTIINTENISWATVEEDGQWYQVIVFLKDGEAINVGGGLDACEASELLKQALKKKEI